MTIYPVCQKTSLSDKPCFADKKLKWNTYMEIRVALSESSIDNCAEPFKESVS